MTSPLAPLPYELRIGVTGHRHLADPTAIAAAVEALLAQVMGVLTAGNREPAGPAGSPKSLLQRLDSAIVNAAEILFPWLPRTASVTPVDRLTPIQLVAVSSLAKGADRIVAHAILNHPEATLEAVLPMPAEAYRRDFVEPSDLAEFDELLGKDAAATVVTPTDPATMNDSSGARNEAYLLAGRRVVDSCEILIVVWDGKPARGRGGTGDVVRYALDRDRIVLWIDANQPAAAPRRLRLPASKSGRSDGVIDAAGCATSVPTVARELSIDFHQLSSYNRDGGFRPAKATAIAERHARELRKHADAAGLPVDRLSPILENLLPHYARADQLAALYHGLYVRGAIGLYALSAIAVSVAAIQALLFPYAVWLIVLEILAMLLAVVLLRIGRTEAWHEKWLQDRYLAERIRSTIFTFLAGTTLRGAVGSKTEEALPFYRGRGGWLNDLPDRLQRQCNTSPVPVSRLPVLRRFLVDAWLMDQSRWHRRNAHLREGKAKRGHRTGQALFTATLVAAGLHLCGVGHDGQGDTTAHVITVLSILLPAWGAAVHAINTLLEHHRLSHRSAQMADLLASIAQAVENTTTSEALSIEVRRAVVAITAENHEWLVSLAFRDLVLPA